MALKPRGILLTVALFGLVGSVSAHTDSSSASLRDLLQGRRLFDEETFGGNGRTCLTCHSVRTGTVSPEDARLRFRIDRNDPLFAHDGSDDEDGDGVGDGNTASRMLADATILMRIRSIRTSRSSTIRLRRFVTVRRGIPTTVNTPALDPVLMLDGRQPSLESQALAAITDHAQPLRPVHSRELGLIALFNGTRRGSSVRRRCSSRRRAAACRRCRWAARTPRNGAAGSSRIFRRTSPCRRRTSSAAPVRTCHSGPMLNQTNQFLPLPVPPGTRFQTVLVSELNEAGHPIIDFVFRNQDVPGGIIDSRVPIRARAHHRPRG